MKTVLYHEFGDAEVMQVLERPVPSIKSNEVLVKVHAASVNPKDVVMRQGNFRFLMPPWFFPLGVGSDLAGEVVEVGAKACPGPESPKEGRSWQVKVGDAVYGHLDGFFGGATAEYAAISAKNIALKPQTLSFLEAGAVSLVFQTALQALRDDAQIKKGDRVCINGASGGVGSAAIQLAKYFGAHVTTISSTRNLDFCHRLGADEALSYQQTDIVSRGQPFDIFLDCFGNRPYWNIYPILAPTFGSYVTIMPSLHMLLLSPLMSFLPLPKKAKLRLVRSRTSDLNLLTQLFEQQTLRPIIEKVYPMAQIAQAQQKVATKHTRGKVVMRVYREEGVGSRE